MAAKRDMLIALSIVAACLFLLAAIVLSSSYDTFLYALQQQSKSFLWNALFLSREHLWLILLSIGNEFGCRTPTFPCFTTPFFFPSSFLLSLSSRVASYHDYFVTEAVLDLTAFVCVIIVAIMVLARSDAHGFILYLLVFSLALWCVGGGIGLGGRLPLLDDGATIASHVLHLLAIIALFTAILVTIVSVESVRIMESFVTCSCANCSRIQVHVSSLCLHHYFLSCSCVLSLYLWFLPSSIVLLLIGSASW